MVYFYDIVLKTSTMYILILIIISYKSSVFYVMNSNFIFLTLLYLYKNYFEFSLKSIRKLKIFFILTLPKISPIGISKH